MINKENFLEDLYLAFDPGDKRPRKAIKGILFQAYSPNGESVLEKISTAIAVTLRWSDSNGHDQ